MLVHIAISGGRVAVTLTALELGRSTLEVGVLIAVFALLPMLCSVQAGRLIDAIGPYKPMRASAIMVIAGTLLPFAWQSLRGSESGSLIHGCIHRHLIEQ